MAFDRHKTLTREHRRRLVAVHKRSGDIGGLIGRSRPNLIITSAGG
jgi:hypothetical protein